MNTFSCAAMVLLFAGFALHYTVRPRKDWWLAVTSLILCAGWTILGVHQYRTEYGIDADGEKVRSSMDARFQNGVVLPPGFE